ncbi:conserved hypothetical protein [Ricinus communis]|uniref:Uncharacterized protein n=1 Tax=Ricinus communis TaxID=3988 RepID=B9RSL3_RICCO|nr:conserved hypothetical protein [Ricinus communis]
MTLHHEFYKFLKGHRSSNSEGQGYENYRLEMNDGGVNSKGDANQDDLGEEVHALVGSVGGGGGVVMWWRFWT